jgi:hypothetical protein
MLDCCLGLVLLLAGDAISAGLSSPPAPQQDIIVAANTQKFDGQWKPSMNFEGSTDQICGGFITDSNIKIIAGNISGHLSHSESSGGFEFSGRVLEDGTISGMEAAGLVKAGFNGALR